MTLTEMRRIASQAARSCLRKHGVDPSQATADDGLDALDDLYRIDAQLIASLWYGQASENQVKLFRREWRDWRKEAIKSGAFSVITNDETGKIHIEKDGEPLCGVSLPRFLKTVRRGHGDLLHSRWMCKKCLARL